VGYIRGGAYRRGGWPEQKGKEEKTGIFGGNGLKYKHLSAASSWERDRGILKRHRGEERQFRVVEKKISKLAYRKKGSRGKNQERVIGKEI